MNMPYEITANTEFDQTTPNNGELINLEFSKIYENFRFIRDEGFDFNGDKKISGTLELASGTSVNEFSVDGAMGGDSDNAVPTEKAVKAYVDNLDSADVKKTGDQTVGGIKTFSSIPVLPGADPTNANQAARKAYVDNKINALVGGAPGALNTLNELAEALNDDDNFASTVTNEMALLESRINSIAPQIGFVIGCVQGYFTNSSNGGFNSVPVSVSGNYYPCDGSAPNDDGSPIWNSADRRVPNLTDERFLMGSTGFGAVGGSNDVLAKISKHYHSASAGDINIITSGSHTHPQKIKLNQDGSESHITFDGGSSGIRSFESTYSASHVHGNSSFSGNVGCLSSSGGISGDSDQYLKNYIGSNKPKYLSVKYYMRIK